MIGQMLEYLKDVVDEIVIVDGGSNDGTIEIIKNFASHSPVPVRLHHREMNKDFSQQRNFAIEQCSGEWILSIDADEKYTNSLKRMLSELINSEKYIAYSLPTFHLIDNDEHFSNLDSDPHVRLFKNIPEIRYNRPIHEVLKYKDDFLTPHPAHMNDNVKNVVSYINDVRLLHYGPLKNQRSLEKKQEIWNKNGHINSSCENGIPLSEDYFVTIKQRMKDIPRHDINYLLFE